MHLHPRHGHGPRVRLQRLWHRPSPRFHRKFPTFRHLHCAESDVGGGDGEFFLHQLQRQRHGCSPRGVGHLQAPLVGRGPAGHGVCGPQRFPAPAVEPSRVVSHAVPTEFGSGAIPPRRSQPISAARVCKIAPSGGGGARFFGPRGTSHTGGFPLGEGAVDVVGVTVGGGDVPRAQGGRQAPAPRGHPGPVPEAPQRPPPSGGLDDSHAGGGPAGKQHRCGEQHGAEPPVRVSRAVCAGAGEEVADEREAPHADPAAPGATGVGRKQLGGGIGGDALPPLRNHPLEFGLRHLPLYVQRPRAPARPTDPRPPLLRGRHVGRDPGAYPRRLPSAGARGTPGRGGG
mmetsp:Transcript_128733/g.293910  ORF Transcript_128733/g.293910 Transcript_128733/m.293910 type:complete len:343 (+) Transcript_128733:612-1640(+)